MVRDRFVCTCSITQQGVPCQLLLTQFVHIYSCAGIKNISGEAGPGQLWELSRVKKSIQEETQTGTDTKPQDRQQGNNDHCSPAPRQSYQTAVSFVCDIKSDCHWYDNAIHSGWWLERGRDVSGSIWHALEAHWLIVLNVMNQRHIWTDTWHMTSLDSAFDGRKFMWKGGCCMRWMVLLFVLGVLKNIVHLSNLR